MKKNKPEIKTIQLYNYMECRDYIQEKYKLDDSELWDKLCDYSMINNPGTFTLYRGLFEEEDSQDGMDFLNKLFEEFGPEEAELEFEVSW